MKTKKLIKALLGISFLTLGMVTVNDVKENKVVDAATENAVAAVDFTSKSASHGAYTDTWKYDGWTVSGGANNNGGWAYVKMGGKKDNLSKYNTIYIASPVVESATSKVEVNIIAGSVAKSGMSATASLEVYSDSALSTKIASTSAQTITKNAALLEFEPASGGSWSANSYYKVVFNCANTSGTNGIVWLDNISIYEAIGGGEDVGGEETPVPTLSIASSANYMDAVGSVTFTPTIENADQTTVTYTSSDPAVAAFEGNVLKAKSVGKVDVTASMVVDGETYTSNTVSVKVWPKANSELTIAEANGLSSLLEHNESTPYSYIVKGKITDIYNEEYGNAHITDEDSNEYTIYGMCDEDGNKYDAMTNKPVVNGTYSFEGQITRYNDTIETKNAVVTKVSVPAGAYFTTQAQLGFTYEYSKEESNVASGSYVVVPSELGLDNEELLGTKTSSDGIVTITGDKGTHTNSAPAYFVSDTTLRAYKGNTITFSANALTSIEIICKSSSYTFAEPAVDGGSYSINESTVTINNITGSEVVITPDKTVRITKITVNYGGSSSSYEFTNFDNYQLRFFAEVQEVQVETIIKEGESIEDLTFGALITPKSYMENSGYASFEAAYAENPNVNFEEVFAAKNVTANYVDGQFGIILNNIPTTDVEVCVVLYAQATDGTMYFVEQKTVSVESVVTAYYNQINSLDLKEEQIEAVKALYAQVTAQA